MVRLFEDCFVSVLLIRIHYIYISVAIWLKGSTLGAPGRQGLPGMAGLVTPQASQVLAGTSRPCLLPHGSTPSAGAGPLGYAQGAYSVASSS